MFAVEYFAIDYIDPDWIRNGPDREWEDALWVADQDTDLSAQIATRNAEIAHALIAEVPGLTSSKAGLDLDEYADEDLSQEAVLRRYHRVRLLAGTWSGGELMIRIFDRALEVSFQMVDLSRDEFPRFTRDVQDLLEKIETASGMRPWYAAEHCVESVAAAVSRLLESRAGALRRHFRSTRRERLKRRMGLPLIALSGVAAFALALGIAADAFLEAKILAGVRTDSPVAFVTDAVPPPRYRWGVFPQFTLWGHIEGQTQRSTLPVFRDEYLRAGVGAPYTVLQTGDPSRPYILRSAYEASLPHIPLRDRGLPWHVAVAVLPLALWYYMFLKPLIGAQPWQREAALSAASHRFGLVLLGGAALLAVVAIRQFP